MQTKKNSQKKYHQYPCPIELWELLVVESADQSRREKTTTTPGKILEGILRKHFNR